MADTDKNTPMMEQYWQVRSSLPQDTVLMFRLGDFYEMFYDDALEGSRILGITLTKRHNYPMAGVPYHSADRYIQKLLESAKKSPFASRTKTPNRGKSSSVRSAESSPPALQ